MGITNRQSGTNVHEIADGSDGITDRRETIAFHGKCTVGLNGAVGEQEDSREGREGRERREGRQV
ncbi:MAG: hypothetical protein ABI882_14610, partial [Acidobacteriota bacterium]